MHLAPRSFALALLVTCLPCVLAASNDSTIPPAPAVRGLQSGATALILQARQRSITINCLVDALDATDLVVYIEFRPYLDTPTARTTFLNASAGHRYLLVSINPRNDVDTRIALLGHELQHAVEIADAPEVSSQQSLATFYARSPHHTGKTHFETAAARHAEEMVREDLRARAGGPGPG